MMALNVWMVIWPNQQKIITRAEGRHAARADSPEVQDRRPALAPQHVHVRAADLPHDQQSLPDDVRRRPAASATASCAGVIILGFLFVRWMYAKGGKGARDSEFDASSPDRRLHRRAVQRQSRRRLLPGRRAGRRVDAERRRGDEPLRDGVPRCRSDDGWSLRWFTPAVEVDLCGHATLASAHAIWSEGRSAAMTMLRFHTRSGVLTATARRRLDRARFPRQARRADRRAGRPARRRSASTSATYVGRNQFDYIVELAVGRRGARAEARSRACCASCPCAASSSPAARQRRLRLRLPLLRARLRHRRRSGHRLRALLPHALLGRSASARPR